MEKSSLTTIDLSIIALRNPQAVNVFLSDNKVTCFNHLISVAPTGQILSYLVNHRMFDEMQVLADKCSVTLYVDDITFSSEQKITREYKEKKFRIIEIYNFLVLKNKVRSYTREYSKLVTGVIIDAKGQLAVKNSLQKIVDEHNNLRKHPDNVNSRQRLRGLVTAARQVKKMPFRQFVVSRLKKSVATNKHRFFVY